MKDTLPRVGIVRIMVHVGVRIGAAAAEQHVILGDGGGRRGGLEKTLARRGGGMPLSLIHI